MINTEELKEYLKVHENTIYNYIKEGMPYYKIGNRSFRFELDEVKEWLKNRTLKIGKK